jgi:peptidoglycan/LPS O-acetylase OafA/YrhL
MTRINRLTSIRGLAALYVFLFHCQNTISGFNVGYLAPFSRKGYLAVDFFFVLSGFILSHVYMSDFDRGRHDHGAFLLLRLGRIYPVHLLTLLLAGLVTLSPLFSQERWLITDGFSFVTNLLLLHSWNLHESLSWNYVSWSISAEWFAYLFFPGFVLLSLPFRSRPWAALAAAGGAVMALGVVMWLVVFPQWLPELAAPQVKAVLEAPLSVAANYGLIRVGFEFLAGVLIFRAHAALRDQPHEWANAASVLAAAVAAVVLVLPWRTPHICQDIAAVIATSALIFCLSLSDGRFGRLLEWRPLVYLGEISYSFYMVHGVSFLIYFAALDALWLAKPSTRLEAYSVAALLAIMTFVGAILTYHWVELPARNATKRRLGGGAVRANKTIRPTA